jgi:hypothetical protein
MRISVERFKQGGGLYRQDQFAPLIESIINIAASVFFVQRIGLAGVMLGTVCSNLLVVFWIKPKIVYKYIFKKSLTDYFYKYALYLILTAAMIFVSNIFLIKTISHTYTITNLLLNCFISVSFVMIVYYIIFFSTSEFLYFKNLITKNLISTLYKIPNVRNHKGKT